MEEENNQPKPEGANTPADPDGGLTAEGQKSEEGKDSKKPAEPPVQKFKPATPPRMIAVFLILILLIGLIVAYYFLFYSKSSSNSTSGNALGYHSLRL